MDIDISQVSQTGQNTSVDSLPKTPVEDAEQATKTEVKTVKDDYRYDRTSLDYSRRSSFRSMRSRGRNVFGRHRATRRRIEISRPRNYQRGSTIQKIKDVIKQIQRKYELPKSKDMVKVLKPATQTQVQELSRQAIADTELVNPKNFFKSLEKVVPLALSTVNNTTPSFPANFAKMIGQLANELQLLVNQMLLSPALSEELKAQLQGLLQQMQALNSSGSSQDIAQQLAQLIAGSTVANNGHSFVNVKGQEALIQELVKLQLLSNKFLGAETIPLKTLASALAQLQGNGMSQSLEQTIALLKSGSASNLEGRQILVTQLALFQMMNQAVPMNAQDQARFMQLMMGNQLLFSSGSLKGVLGVKTQELAQKMSEWLVQMAQQLGVSPNHPILNKSGSESLFRLFSSILFGGAILGRMISDRGDGKAWVMDDAYAGQLQMQSVRDLKIFDLVPFSLFAFFTPLKKTRNSKEHEREQQANKLLKALIRLIMKLAFMLSSIYTGGKKIGAGGIELMLDMNRKQLDDVLKQLMSVMKKTGETGQVEVKAPITFLRRSRQALVEKDYSVFWTTIFAFFTDKNDLNALLSEVEELDTVYSSIHSLIK